MWKALFDSVRGTAHIDSGAPCQDACRVLAIRGSDGEYLVAVCADGAGSAELSHIGAEIACDRFIDLARGAIESDRGCLPASREDAVAWCAEVRRVIDERAAELLAPIRSLACTLLAAILGPRHSVFIQVGDGAMVAAKHGVFGVVFWPQSGEYANTTNFVTDESADCAVDFCLHEGELHEYVAFTDGLERLALRFAEQTVHVPFANSLLAPLRRSQPLDLEDYFVRLRDYLASEKINERTNDDKTLILATRNQGQDHASSIS